MLLYSPFTCLIVVIVTTLQRQPMPTLDDDSGSDREDELPQVVVLKSGDLTADEVKKDKDKENPVTRTEKGKKKNS